MTTHNSYIDPLFLESLRVDGLHEAPALSFWKDSGGELIDLNFTAQETQSPHSDSQTLKSSSTPEALSLSDLIFDTGLDSLDDLLETNFKN